MIAALLLTAASIPSAVDAEHAFAADARKIGQWTAFRKYADHDAVMFAPQAVWVRDFLADRRDPPQTVRWAPAHSYLSCDGRIAVNTGPWWGADGVHHGYFTTVWQRTKSGWRWVYDGGDVQEGPLPPSPAAAKVHQASCRGRAPGAPITPSPALTSRQARTTPDDNGRGQSGDRTLGWDWKVEKNGARRFRVYQWTGSRYAEVLVNNIAAPPAR